MARAIATTRSASTSVAGSTAPRAIATVNVPAARALVRPVAVSSTVVHSPGSTPSPAAAARYGAGCGLWSDHVVVADDRP